MNEQSFKDFIFKFLKKDIEEDAPANSAGGGGVAGIGVGKDGEPGVHPITRSHNKYRKKK